VLAAKVSRPPHPEPPLVFVGMENTDREYSVFNIEYDMDGEPVIPNPPTELNMNVPADIVDVEEFIADTISNVTGWCVFGFDYEEI